MRSLVRFRIGVRNDMSLSLRGVYDEAIYIVKRALTEILRFQAELSTKNFSSPLFACANVARGINIHFSQNWVKMSEGQMRVHSDFVGQVCPTYKIMFTMFSPQLLMFVKMNFNVQKSIIVYNMVLCVMINTKLVAKVM